VLIPDPDSIHKTIEIIGIEYSVKRKPRRTTMEMIKRWLEAIKNFLAPKKQTTKRKTNVKRTTRKKSK
jgi:ribosomal protein S5